MTGKGWMHRAMKDWDPSSAKDEDAKVRVQDVLRAKWGYKCVFDRTIFIDKNSFTIHTEQPKDCTSKEDVYKKYYIHIPDILIRTVSGTKVVELDGDVHFNSSKGVKNTNLRNEHYEYANIKLVWFYTPTLMKMSTEEIIKHIEDACWL